MHPGDVGRKQGAANWGNRLEIPFPHPLIFWASQPPLSALDFLLPEKDRKDCRACWSYQSRMGRKWGKSSFEALVVGGQKSCLPTHSRAQPSRPGSHASVFSKRSRCLCRCFFIITTIHCMLGIYQKQQEKYLKIQVVIDSSGSLGIVWRT